jgi:hypothetical protein
MKKAKWIANSVLGWIVVIWLVGCSEITTQHPDDLEVAWQDKPIVTESSDELSSDAESSDTVSSETVSSDAVSSNVVSSDVVSSDVVSSDAVSSEESSSSSSIDRSKIIWDIKEGEYTQNGGFILGEAVTGDKSEWEAFDCSWNSTSMTWRAYDLGKNCIGSHALHVDVRVKQTYELNEGNEWGNAHIVFYLESTKGISYLPFSDYEGISLRYDIKAEANPYVQVRTTKNTNFNYPSKPLEGRQMFVKWTDLQYETFVVQTDKVEFDETAITAIAVGMDQELTSPVTFTIECIGLGDVCME